MKMCWGKVWINANTHIFYHSDFCRFYWLLAYRRTPNAPPRFPTRGCAASSVPDAASDIQGSAAEEPPVNINLDTAEIEYKQQ